MLVLNEVNGLDNILVVKRGGDAELTHQLLDVLLLGLVPSPFPELLDGKELFRLFNLVGQPDDGRGALTNVTLVTDTVFLQERAVGFLEFAAFASCKRRRRATETVDKVEDVFLLERAGGGEEIRVLGGKGASVSEGRRWTVRTRLWLVRVENLMDQGLLLGRDGD